MNNKLPDKGYETRATKNEFQITSFHNALKEEVFTYCNY